MESILRNQAQQRRERGLAGLGSHPTKRRSTPIPVLPPRIPTPMPNVANNNNPQTRVVTGGNCNKTITKEQFLRKRATEAVDPTPLTNLTKICPKYLDNDIQTAWINPRLMSKIDLGAVISTDYNIQPAQKMNNMNSSYQQQNYNHYNVSHPQQTSSHYHHCNQYNATNSRASSVEQPHQQQQQRDSAGMKTHHQQQVNSKYSMNGSRRAPPPGAPHLSSCSVSASSAVPLHAAPGSATATAACAGANSTGGVISASVPVSSEQILSVCRRAERIGHRQTITVPPQQQHQRTNVTGANNMKQTAQQSVEHNMNAIPSHDGCATSNVIQKYQPRAQIAYHKTNKPLPPSYSQAISKLNGGQHSLSKSYPQHPAGVNIKHSQMNSSNLPTGPKGSGNKHNSNQPLYGVPKHHSSVNGGSHHPGGSSNHQLGAGGSSNHQLGAGGSSNHQLGAGGSSNHQLGAGGSSNHQGASGSSANVYNKHSSPYQIFQGQVVDGVVGSVSASLMAAGVASAGASVYGIYESRFAYSVNGLPGNSSQASAAAAFFARAAQKLNLSSSPHRRKRHSSGDEEIPATGFCGVIQRSPPPVPPALLRRIGVKEVTGVGKVKVMLRVASTSSTSTESSSTSSSSFFSLDKRKKQVTLFDPSVCSGSSAPEDRRVGVAAPKMFAFDAIFSQDDSQTEVCSSALTDVIHAVINGTDGCLFCFGHAGLGKSYTMLGSTENANTLGIIPCAITWLFRGINEQKQKTGARFSVRVSAVEVCGPSNQLKDLLVGHANESEQSPGVYLRDDPLFGTQLQNHSELRVPSAERAAFYLDAAIDSRGPVREQSRDSHLLYTLHVYQYSVAGKGGVAGGRSRLHLIDLGNSEKGKASGGIPLSGLGNILLAIFNGQKHLPYREHKLTHVLKECLSSLTCHAAMIAHVSPCAQNYADTLTTVQLASRIHRMRRRKIKFVTAATGTGSGGSSGEEATRTTGTSSEPDPSSSDLSADTVIYVGPADDATDGEHPPVYIPSLNSGDNRCAMGKALRGSSAEHRPSKVPTVQKSSSGHDDKFPKGSSSAKQSPSHSSPINKSSPAHISSAKSSPVRNISKSSVSKISQPLEQSQSNSKIPIYNSSNPVSNSDEQWIDGPRISKSKVAEARHFMKEVGHVKKRETWIDGPLQANALQTHGTANSGYGYMDNHKKSMIRKWVENQTNQIQKTKHVAPTKIEHKQQPNNYVFKELTTFKTSEDDDILKEVNPLIEDSCKKQEVEKSTIRTGLKMSADKHSDSIPECKSSEEVSTPCSELSSNKSPTRDRDLDMDDDEEVEIPPALPLIQPLSSREVSMESLDVRLKERLLSQVDLDDQNTEYDDDDINNDDDDEVLEIIEVEEPLEPVPMQDCCLQVTEEDIARCMSALGNPMPEDDQGNPDEHPLRILSQENLTVVSTFTDSLSVFTDLERVFPRNRYDLPAYTFSDGHAYSVYSDDYEDPDCPAPDILRNVNPDDASRRKFEQLARLHELYTDRLAKANVTNSATYQQQKQLQKSLSRCESLSITDMLYGNIHETGSIYSEPPYRPDQDKFCENCKINLSRPATAQNWYADPQLSASATHLAQTENFTPLGGRFQRFCHRLSRDNCNIASLRHPDGASNPNLKEEIERVPGNGASGSDEDDKEKLLKKEDKRTVPGKELHRNFETNEGIIQPLPPPVSLPSQERLNRRMLSISSGLAAIKQAQQQQSEGYDSGHDSTPRTSKHSPAAISRRAESGYDSVVRDSESSSIDSDISRQSHAVQSRGVNLLRYYEEEDARMEYYWNDDDRGCGERIKALKFEQLRLKGELAAAKARLLIPRSRWNYERK